MNTSASWSLKLTKLVVMHLDAIFSNEVTIHFYMLGPLMKDRVGCDVKSNLIIIY